LLIIFVISIFCYIFAPELLEIMKVLFPEIIEDFVRSHPDTKEAFERNMTR